MGLFKRDQFKQLEKALGKGKLLREPHDIALYGMDATSLRGSPTAVALPESAADIQEVVRFAASAGLTITPRGAGSGLSGGSVPVDGGILLSLERMRSIETVNLRDRRVVVQAGVVTADLQQEVQKYGLFYPPDPSSHSVSTIGGNVAENAGGLRCFKYGVTSHYVLGVEYVNAEGDICSTGSLSQGAVEPDLTPLMVGSEGTLGVITRIELQLIPAPAATVTHAAYFAKRDSALEAVEKIIAAGLVPSILEFIDRQALEASAAHCGLNYPPQAQALLLVESDGSIEQAEETAQAVEEILLPSAVYLERARDAGDRDRLWRLRRGISPSLIRLATGKIHEDIAVPRGSLGALAQKIEAISEEKNLAIPIYGHAGDGNLHVVILFDSADPKMSKKAEETSKEIFRAALDLGGTITGEHGVGFAKREMLKWQLSENVLALSKQVKRKFDPEGLFNPSKVLM